VWHVCRLVGQTPLHRAGLQIRSSVCWQGVEILGHLVGIDLELCFLGRGKLERSDPRVHFEARGPSWLRGAEKAFGSKRGEGVCCGEFCSGGGV
jgi:hypothetical protein